MVSSAFILMSIKHGKKSIFKKVFSILTSHLRSFFYVTNPGSLNESTTFMELYLRDIFTKSAADIWYGNKENKMKYN